jgi:hypothetical protein
MAMVGLMAAGCAHDRDASLHGFTWRYMQTPQDGAKLAYGGAASSDVAMMFSCAPRSGQVRLEARGDAPQGLILSSQGVTARLDATAAGATPGGLPLMSSNLAADDKTLAHFAATGRLQFIAGGASIPVDASGAERAAVRGFFAACRTKA